MSLAVLFASCAPGASIWTPNDSDLVYMSNKDSQSAIYLVPAGATESVKLTQDQARDNWPVWSPDGRQIAFQRWMNDNFDIWIMNADGTDPVQLTHSSSHDYLPSWLPDGKQLTFTSRRVEGDEEVNAHIYIMNADGSDQKRLVQEPLNTSSAAEWAPDGRSFIFSRQIGEAGADLYLATDQGKIEKRLTEDTAHNGAAVFSPDGRKIAFYSDGGDGAEIVVMNRDGSVREVVVSTGNSWYPQWSPDGRWLLYTGSVDEDDKDLDLFAVPVNGQVKPILLVGGPGREAEGRWRPSAN